MKKFLNKNLYLLPIFMVLFCIAYLVKLDIDKANYISESESHIIYINIPDASKIQETLWKIETSNYGFMPKILERNGDTYKIEVKCPPDSIEKIKNRLKP